jgi:deoxyribose-phosphate aldolase
MSYTVSQLAKMIDHSLLHPTMTDGDLEEGCALAIRYQTASVCVKPYAVKKASELLKGSGVLTCTVVGFPHGGCHTDIKVAETRLACLEGATEIDMVVNIGKVKGGEWTYVEQEIGAVNREALSHGAIVKVIFENDYLADDEKIRLCEICSAIPVAFVKTSTGYGYVKGTDGKFSTQGATLPDLRLMRANCPPTVQVKAAGGVRSYTEMLKAIDAGATRIGATATQAILDEAASGTLIQPGNASANAGY